MSSSTAALCLRVGVSRRVCVSMCPFDPSLATTHNQGRAQSPEYATHNKGMI